MSCTENKRQVGAHYLLIQLYITANPQDQGLFWMQWKDFNSQN